MPWSASDADKHSAKADTPDKRKQWAKVANAARKQALEEGKSEEEADAYAIKAANAAMSKTKEDIELSTATITEYASSAGLTLKVDRENHIIHGVKILGLQSKNRGDKANDYPPKTLIEAAPKYENAPVFVDHAPEGANRSYKDRNGVLKNVTVREDGLYADHFYNPAHPITEQYLFDAENAPQNCGFSHEADGKRRYDPTTKRYIVEEIIAVHSVDLVARPATASGLFESENPDDTSGDIPRDPLLETSFCALDLARTILEDEKANTEEKKTRLAEALATWRRELIEGEISDKIAADANVKAMQKINYAADDMISQALYDGDKYPTVADKKARILSVLADWESEMSKLPSAGTTSKQESQDMEIKDLTTEMLQKERPDLVEQLTGNDEMSKLKATVLTLQSENSQIKESLDAYRAKEAEAKKEADIAAELKEAHFDVANKKIVSESFMQQLRAASDTAARKALILDRKVLISEQQQDKSAPSAPPFAPVSDPQHERDARPAGNIREALHSWQ